jgi:hypothetical protein
VHTYKWIESEVPNGLEIRQVYGFIFATDGRVLLLKDAGHFNLPGGKPEDKESIYETLVRESLEEVQTMIHSLEYMGYQLIEGSETFAQVRLAAIVDRFLPTDKDPSTGRQYRRLLVPPVQLDGLLKWGESGKQQVTKAIATGSELGVFWDGTPLSYIETD